MKTIGTLQVNFQKDKVTLTKEGYLTECDITPAQALALAKAIQIKYGKKK